MTGSRDGLAALLGHTTAVLEGARGEPRDGGLRVGVDLGTAYTVVVATDGTGWPLAGAYAAGGTVRDGVVVDFHGAIRLVKRLKAEIEERLERPLVHAASGFPPGVGRAEVRAVQIGTIVAGAIAGHHVPELSLVGGTCRFPRIAEVLGEVTGVPATLPGDPLFVTALGLAGNDTEAGAG